MAWEMRGQGRYYYRKRRVGRRVVSEYIGSGEVAAVIARLDALDRRIRHEQRALNQAERRDADAEEQEFEDWYARIEDVYRAVMAAAGYLRHARGQWRRRRVSAHKIRPEASAGPPVVAADLDALMDRARKGDWEAAQQVRRALAHDPGRLIRGDCDLKLITELYVATLVEDRVRRVCEPGKPENRLRLEAFREQAQQLRAALAGPSPSPIEDLLADRAALCWLRVQQYEWELGSEGRTIAQADLARRRLDSAHARLLSALKALAAVRKLALPALQVNIAAAGGQQVNVAGDVRK